MLQTLSHPFPNNHGMRDKHSTRGMHACLERLQRCVVTGLCLCAATSPHAVQPCHVPHCFYTHTQGPAHSAPLSPTLQLLPPTHAASLSHSFPPSFPPPLTLLPSPLTLYLTHSPYFCFSLIISACRCRLPSSTNSRALLRPRPRPVLRNAPPLPSVCFVNILGRAREGVRAKAGGYMCW